MTPPEFPRPPILTPEQRDRRGRAAREAMNNELVQQALNEIEADAWQDFTASDLMDQTRREISYLRVRAIREVRAHLTNWSQQAKR